MYQFPRPDVSEEWNINRKRSAIVHLPHLASDLNVK
jgi:hypothetical protein